MDPDPALLLTIAALLSASAFFSAAESALLARRRNRVEPSSRPDDAVPPRAPGDRADHLALAAQLGRSAAALLLGFVLAAALRPRLGEGAVAAALAAAVLAHAVVGDQVPRLVASRRAARVARLTEGPLRVFALLLRPLTWPLSAVLPRVLRALGVPWEGAHPLAYTAEEIRMFVARSSEEGGVEEDEREMIHGVFEISRTVAREVMTPRTEVVAVPDDVTLDGLVEVAVTEGHSRIPVYEGSIDNIVGVVLTKDLFPLLRTREGASAAFDVRGLMREPYFVPDTKPVDDLLAEFRRERVHLAVVLDEFGGTYGVVTLEDLLEEIVGEINDEYDEAEPEFAHTPEGDVLIDGAASISEVNGRFGIALPEEDFDTLGGYIFGALERVPRVGDVVAAPSQEGMMELRVERIEERRVTLVRLARASPVAEPAP